MNHYSCEVNVQLSAKYCSSRRQSNVLCVEDMVSETVHL